MNFVRKQTVFVCFGDFRPYVHCHRYLPAISSVFQVRVCSLTRRKAMRSLIGKRGRFSAPIW